MKTLFVKIFAAVSYVAMVTVNFLANSLPINNRGTGEISDDYPNLFAPAGVTFSIWGLIYLLLGGYVVYQFVNKNPKAQELIKKINPIFIVNALANISWIFAWHYDNIALSVAIMAVILVSLIKIADITRTEKLAKSEELLIVTPFSIYFGWITVATIANIAVFLVSIGWNRFGIADYIWTVVILLIGAAIGITRLFKDRKIAYGLVLVWAYLGILLKHVSQTGFASRYPSIITTVIFCVVLFLVSIFFVYRKQSVAK